MAYLEILSGWYSWQHIDFKIISVGDNLLEYFQFYREIT